MSGKNTFEELFSSQEKFQELVEGVSPKDDPRRFQYHMSAMVEELGEVLKADKRWKNYRNTVFVEAEKLDELSDVFITAMNLVIWSGFTKEQLLEAIGNKIEKNIKRVEMERRSKK